MAGRRPTPTHLRLLQGNPQKRRINRNEPQPAIPAEPPEPPDFLMPTAKDEWHRVIGELHALGLFAAVDLNLLAAYCQSCGRWRQAEEALAAMCGRDPVTGGLLIKTAAGNAMYNPLVGIARKAAADMVRYGNEFGLGAAARSRISGGLIGQTAPNKFDGLLA
jgi:P27 family predicted phage terminase small subunit